MIEETETPEVEETGEVTETAEETQTEAPESSEEAPPSLEDVASSMGWAPQDQWRGDPEKWKPAHKFVADTAEINSKLANKLTSVERQVEAMARTSATIMDRTLAEERQKWLNERQEAFEIGDSEKFNAADKRLNELQQQVPQTAVVPQEAQEFVERHKSWWGVDTEATQWAQKRAGQLAEQGLSEKRQIAIVESEMQQYFPDLVKPTAVKPAPKAAPLNQPGKRSNSQPKAKTFQSLPAEVQKAALDFEKRGRCTKEEYAQIYYEEQEA